MFDEPEFDEPDDEFDEDEDEQFLSPQMVNADLLNAIMSGTQYVTGTIYEHRTTIRNIAVIAGGAYLLVKGPPIAAKSLAETMHHLREAWYGRGYENRWGS
jgi:hypothetical protein